MTSLLYSPLDIAAIISFADLGVHAESELINRIWQEEKPYLPSTYHSDQRKFALEVRYWLEYLYNKPALDREFPAIKRDMLKTAQSNVDDKYISDFSDLDLFFKNVRLQILYMNGRDYVRVKIRTILKKYGYKRRSAVLVSHIKNCMSFYHIEGRLSGGIPCNIEKDSLDSMITFRVI